MDKTSDRWMIRAQMGHILYYRRTSFLAVLGAQVLVLFGLWSVYSHTLLLAWLFAMQSVSLPQFLISERYKGKALSLADIRYLKRVFILYALVSSSLWGALGWLLDGSWDIHAFYILLPMLGIFAGAINLSAILSIYFSLALPILIQSLAVLLFSDAAQIPLAGFFIIFYAGMISFTLELHKMLKQTYHLQYELEVTNRDLAVQKKTAEQANRDKSRFLAAASHDLRQPLYAMELFIGGLEQDKYNSNKAHLLKRLRNALDGMQKMFMSLLDMSRFDAGVITPVKKNFSAARLLQTLEREFGEECAEKGIRLRVRSIDLWGYSDPMLIKRVLENFLSNALKYTDSGTILLACRKHGETLLFQVWDTGRGIRAKAIGTIFNAFHQLENPERDRRKGVGLGLSIVQQIADLLQTPIQVHSRPGKGSLFSIRVPIGTRQAYPTEAPSPPASIHLQTITDREIWIIDDDPDVLEGLQFQLETWGCITRTADSQEQVALLLEKHPLPPDFIISDLRLRRHQSGIEVIHSIRDRYTREIPATIITGDTGPIELKLLSRANIDFLHKPISSERLLTTIAKAVTARGD